MKKIFNSFLFLTLFLVACNKDNSANETQIQSNEGSIQSLVAVLSPYDWSMLLVNNVTPTNNVYVNGVGSVTWSGQNGATNYTCNTDCSGYFNRLLTQTYGYTTAYYQTWTGVNRPLAKHYYNEIVTGDHFTAISNVAQIQKGDFVAIKYPQDATNTGHCMLVAAAAVSRVATAPIINATNQYELSIIDCASSGHGSTDTRYPTSDDGIGKGVFRLYTDAAGTIKGYTWSTFSNSVYYNQATRPLVIGRLIP